ncbi:hypothetical protein KC19_10G076200 [Ceratodon purpureus]|uniref:F-box domain-containing protein n=1 Tax=Ceratodon purpureus TaxID=3225 RepID=A0A8T0GLD4_CERPU|nr:hypothetical protein KC19_10G076200 [Ceratodon purpureus]
MDPALWSELPLEIVEQVLSFVPARNLFRFCTVCRSWNILIHNPNFANRQFINAGNCQSASYERILHNRFTRGQRRRRRPKQMFLNSLFAVNTVPLNRIYERL